MLTYSTHPFDSYFQRTYKNYEKSKDTFITENVKMGGNRYSIHTLFLQEESTTDTRNIFT